MRSIRYYLTLISATSALTAAPFLAANANAQAPSGAAPSASGAADAAPPISGTATDLLVETTYADGSMKACAVNTDYGIEREADSSVQIYRYNKPNKGYIYQTGKPRIVDGKVQRLPDGRVITDNLKSVFVRGDKVAAVVDGKPGQLKPEDAKGYVTALNAQRGACTEIVGNARKGTKNHLAAGQESAPAPVGSFLIKIRVYLAPVG